jgi:hypothetical protein
MTVTNVSNLYTSDDLANITGNPTTTNNFSVNYTVAPSTTRTIDVFTDLSTLGAGTVQPTLKITAFGSLTNVALTTGAGIATALSGQVMTVRPGSLAAPTLTTASAASQFVVGGSSPQLATYNFVATNGNANITELKFTVITTATAIDHICVGAVCAPVIAGVATVAGLNIPVVAGFAGANVAVTPTFSLVGTGQQATNSVAKMTLTNMKYTIGNTTTSTAVSIASTEKDMNLVATKPSVTVAQPSAVLTTGSVNALNVTVTADAAGVLRLESFPITSTLSTAGALFTAAAVVVKDSNDQVVASTGSCTSAITCAVTVVLTNGYQLSAGQSQTFKVFLPVSNIGTVIDSPNNAMYTSLVASAGWSWTDISGGGAGSPITNTTYMYNYPSTFVSNIHN